MRHPPSQEQQSLTFEMGLGSTNNPKLPPDVAGMLLLMYPTLLAHLGINCWQIKAAVILSIFDLAKELQTKIRQQTFQCTRMWVAVLTFYDPIRGLS